MTKIHASVLLLACMFLPPISLSETQRPPQDQVRREQESGYRIDVSPRRALVDEMVQIRVLGLQAGQRVTLRAEMEDPPGSSWQSSATFEASAEGAVNVTEQAPMAGSYGSVDPMGLFWSMSPVGTIADPWTPVVVEPVDPGEPLTVTLKAEVEGQPAVSAVVERLFAEADVARHDVRDEGLVGTLFVPPGPKPRAAVLVLHGGTCQPAERKAALIAAHGFVTLALQWCGAEGQPDIGAIEPGGVPLEYFGKAIDWLKQREEVAGAKLGVVGVSLGAEAALLVGANFPDIRAVVSIKGSGVVFGNRWTLGGEPIPHVTSDVPDRLVWAFWSDQPDECWPPGFSSSDFYRYMMGEPIDSAAGEGLSCANTEPRYLNYILFKAFADPESLARAVIPVERINGPVLLVSGHGDRAWPSTLFSEVVVNRLEANNHPFVFEHLAFPGAGHRISSPYLPTTLGGGDVGGDVGMGGDPEGTALANRVYWPQMLEFLKTHLVGES